MAKAAQRPGIDPRVWLTYGTVKEIGIDPAHGVFADVALQPDGNVETCYIGTACAGSVEGTIGWGDWEPLEVDDTVLVGIPMGDSAMGPVVITRFWNSGDPPPTQIADGDEPTKDRWIIAKPGQKLNLLATLAGLFEAGGAKLELDPSGGVKLHTALPLIPVSLGDDTAMPLAHAAEVLAALSAISTNLNAIALAIDAVVTAGGGATPVTNLVLQGYLSASLKAVATGIAAVTATLPTTKVKGT